MPREWGRVLYDLYWSEGEIFSFLSLLDNFMNMPRQMYFSLDCFQRNNILQQSLNKRVHDAETILKTFVEFEHAMLHYNKGRDKLHVQSSTPS